MPADQQFQRARRPEQVEARRSVILDAAEAMLRERSVTDVTLREISDRAGLAKSGVLRYFDSREAIFLEILDRSRAAWLDRLAGELTSVRPVPGSFGREIAIATAIATSLTGVPLLCDLVAATASVLERNISVDVARSFKNRASAHSQRLADLVRSHLPHLSEADAAHFAGAVFVVTAGLWPYAHPTPAVVRVMAEMRVPGPMQMFVAGLTDGLVNQLVGIAALARRGADGAGAAG